jgi:hypothetical protein
LGFTLVDVRSMAEDSRNGTSIKPIGQFLVIELRIAGYDVANFQFCV